MKFKCPNCGAEGAATELKDWERENAELRDALKRAGEALTVACVRAINDEGEISELRAEINRLNRFFITSGHD